MTLVPAITQLLYKLTELILTDAVSSLFPLVSHTSQNLISVIWDAAPISKISDWSTIDRLRCLSYRLWTYMIVRRASSLSKQSKQKMLHSANSVVK